jgi:predicted pyridoxine 5'-phosphate oxidase superfamily flavin-nucleotide-binding protein
VRHASPGSLTDAAVAFIEQAPFLVMSTSDAAGNIDSSPKGDAPGFVTIEDRRTLVIPDRRGNRLVSFTRAFSTTPTWVSCS